MQSKVLWSLCQVERRKQRRSKDGDRKEKSERESACLVQSSASSSYFSGAGKEGKRETHSSSVWCNVMANYFRMR